MILDPFMIERDGVSVRVVVEALIEDGRPVAGIYQLDGVIGLPPRAWRRFIRDELHKLEDVARQAGCVEFRVAGRDWSRLLSEYEPMNAPGVRNGLRKAL